MISGECKLKNERSLVDLNDTDPPLMRVEEAARLLRISKGLCYRLVKSGDIPSMRLGQRRVLVIRSGLEKMIEQAGGGVKH